MLDLRWTLLAVFLPGLNKCWDLFKDSRRINWLMWSCQTWELYGWQWRDLCPCLTNHCWGSKMSIHPAVRILWAAFFFLHRDCRFAHRNRLLTSSSMCERVCVHVWMSRLALYVYFLCVSVNVRTLWFVVSSLVPLAVLSCMWTLSPAPYRRFGWPLVGPCVLA